MPKNIDKDTKIRFLSWYNECYINREISNSIDAINKNTMSEKVIFGYFRHILDFLISVKNGGGLDFLYFIYIDRMS